MRLKLILILALLGAVLVSMTAGTLSGFTSRSAFGATVVPDTAAIRSGARAQEKTNTGQFIAQNQ